jgi:hypothetical protein
MVHYRLSPRFTQELVERKEKSGITWWTGTMRTNILDFDIPSSPPAEKCPNTFRVD